MIKQYILSKIHLIISILIVVPVAFVYGFNPEFLFEIHPESTDEHNILKAIMGLYLGLATIWILGLYKPYFYRTALTTNTVFMLGLGLGRCLSMLTEGMPSPAFIFGTIGELVLGVYGLWVLKAEPFRQN
ncbi:DUF4345 domain-containing protein [Winogradskyella aurantia]|uniref:DUF4345 domain-containing protein n=1 Tax=Winogradskyella aurantia TaxID=1915063 RepID=A0A265UZY2_9FLAO|nr:DUF4345 domain-containing protein [Winogradskyella aurantia]OZV70875.1 hypothetical protein CA834_01800 [Winogradskyella aurantia]